MAVDKVINTKWKDVRVGSCVRWTTPTFVKRGTVTFKKGVSMRVWLWGDDKETVIPLAREYWTGHSQYGMVELEQVKGRPVFVTAPGTSSPVIGEVLNTLNVDQIANILGTNPKDVRRKLRSGKLKGYREEGHWYMRRKDLPK
jgi:hypothetical protein